MFLCRDSICWPACASSDCMGVVWSADTWGERCLALPVLLSQLATLLLLLVQLPTQTLLVVP